MKFNILFSILATREAVFFGNLTKELESAGLKVGLISFNEACDRILEEKEIPYFSIPKLSTNINVNADISSISKLEEKYNINNIRSLFIHDALSLNKTNEAELAEKVMKYLSVLETIFNGNSVDVVIQELGGFIANQVVYYACKKNNIRHMSIEPAMYGGRVNFVVDTLMPVYKKADNITDIAYKEAEKFISSYNNDKLVNKPEKDSHHYKDMGLKKLFSLYNVKRLFIKTYQKYIRKEQEEYDALWYTIKSNIFKYFRRKFLSRYYKEPNDREKYFYYPLHVPHDFQIYVRSPEFKNQESLIDYIAGCLPYGYKLYVKEHPACIGAHELGLTKRYMTGNNIRLIHPKWNSYDLIKNSEAVVTVNSKVGAEAIIQGKPVIVLGKAFYKNRGITQDVVALDELRDVIREAPKHFPESAKVKEFLAEMYDVSYPGELYLNTKENISDFSKTITKVCNDLA